jgi:hypothetical protein
MRQPLSWVTVLALSTLSCTEGFDANPTAPSSAANRYTVAAIGVGVVSYEMPGVAFQLRFSLIP